MVRPAGFEPASPRLKGEHPGPLDEGRIGAGSEDRTHTSWLEAKHVPQYAIPALIWRRVEGTILTGGPADRMVRVRGFEPLPSAFQVRSSTSLSYTLMNWSARQDSNLHAL